MENGPNTASDAADSQHMNLGGGAIDGKSIAVVGSPSTEVGLESLASRYEEAQHKTYLVRLNAAVADDRNRNIALTGRYGAGKSSVLDQFEDSHQRTRRLAISTLGPDADAMTKTNRIQKELVKQLIYSAKPRTLRRSRFSRISALPLLRSFGESVALLICVGALLAMLGWLPPVAGTNAGQPWYQQLVVWAAFSFLLGALATGLRIVLHDKFFVSDVSAAGAAVRLSPRTPTYFDEYLDEIANYFDEEDVDIVILEDLDRFDDPHIFEALRELNTLLNSTPKRVKSGQSLRFIYAVRDSLFERLGSDTVDDGGDAATAETVRANRTKFFDLVIPMVPFISHRNAQDLLAGLLADAGITGIDRRLVELVAKHTTDMRLLRNMRNEFLVFSERLLEQDKRAPGLRPSGLFALVAYKNFHLEDFEQISRRRSDLDQLYDYRRDLVRASVVELERRKRELLIGRAQIRSMKATTERLGTRLQHLSELVRASSQFAGWPYLRFQVEETDFSADEILAYDFWLSVAREGKFTVQVAPNVSHGGQSLVVVSGASLGVLFPEVSEAARWLEMDEDKTLSTITQIDRDITSLRGADFRGMADRGTYKLTVDNTNGAEVEQVQLSFSELVDKTMKSELAGDLVKRGYIDRNFALYAAQFYGEFTGVDVATFIVQSVQPNIMDIDYSFTSVGAVRNLLEATGGDFTHDVAAYNIEVVDYLLERRDDRIENIVKNIVDHLDVGAMEFLTAYLSSGQQRQQLAALLSRHGWVDVFTYLSGDVDVPADVRTSVVDAALLGVNSDVTYNLEHFVCDYFVEHYRDMLTFTERYSPNETRNVAQLLAEGSFRVPELESVHESLRAELVRHDLYVLDADNLRSALGVTGDVSLDRVREKPVVFELCLKNPRRYLSTVANDGATEYTVVMAETLAAVLPVVDERWEEDEIRELIDGSGPASTLESLATGIPVSTWTALAAAHRFRASLANLETYRAEIGAIDDGLAQLLLGAGEIDTEGAPEALDRKVAALALINASDAIGDPADRVKLARSLKAGTVPVAQVAPEAGPLLALLIEQGLVKDNAESFLRFQAHGWAAFEPAILASSKFEEFMTPQLVAGMVAPLFLNGQIRDRVGRCVADNLALYIPADDRPALIATARFALAEGITVPPDQIRRVAAIGFEARNLTMRLLQCSSPGPTPDEIVSIVNELGSPYSYLTSRAEDAFDVDADDAHRAVFGKLKAAGRCTFTARRSKPLLAVKLT